MRVGGDHGHLIPLDIQEGPHENRAGYISSAGIGRIIDEVLHDDARRRKAGIAVFNDFDFCEIIGIHGQTFKFEFAAFDEQLCIGIFLDDFDFITGQAAGQFH